MVTAFMLSFLLIQAAPLPTPDDSATIAAQRTIAEAHVTRRSFSEAGEAYIKLASMRGVVRRDELDRAHLNFDSAYLTSNVTRHLCRALQVAEMTIAEGGFEDEQEAKFWQDIRDDDLVRLQADARATGEPTAASHPVVSDGASLSRCSPTMKPARGCLMNA